MISLVALFLLSSAERVLRTPGPDVRITGENIGPANVTNFAGYIKVHSTRNLFFWFFESQNSPSTDPLILWMTGGPGCSGMLALFVENGPYKVDANKQMSLNPYSWNNKANIIFIDQPVGTGYSYDESWIDPGVLNEKEMAADMTEFLEKFLVAHPKYAKLKFFIAAESYGGHYAPALAHYIVTKPNQTVRINLAGVLVGDGLVDPYNQYPAYASYAYDHGLVNWETYDLMRAAELPCQYLISKCAGTNAASDLAAHDPNHTIARMLDRRAARKRALGESFAAAAAAAARLRSGVGGLEDCIEAVDECNLSQIEPVAATGVNLYDIRIPCAVKPLCYDFSNVTHLLNDPAMMKQLGTTGHAWESCNRLVTVKLLLAGDWMKTFAFVAPELLKMKIPMLIYHGNKDFICNWYGGRDWTSKLVWPGTAGFNSSPNVTYTVNGKQAGSYHTYQGFSLLKILDAGHMVPMDQPVVALDMVNRFMNGGWPA